jgi:hypothetical protein
MSRDDTDRPPVLAHQRFMTERESFAGMNLLQRFQRIHDSNLWGAAETLSGLGSEIDATAVLRAELPQLLKELGVTSLLDAPCGDAGWINKMKLGVSYVGIDIVPDLIAGLRASAAAGEIAGDYHLADITQDELPRCDPVPRRSRASVVCQYRARRDEFRPHRRGVADHDQFSGLADQR